MKDGEKEEMKDKDRDVPASPDLLTAKQTDALLKGTPPLTRDPLSTRETSSDSRATEGGVGGGDCGNCPSCLITAYLDAHDHIVTEVVHISEGVWIGPDGESFNPETFEVLGDIHDGIGAMAIERDNELAQKWWRGQVALALLASMGYLQ